MVRGQNMVSAHRQNRTLILRSILQQPGLSRANLSELTGLTPASITNITAALLKGGWIVEDGYTDQPRGVGRPSIGVRVSRGRHYVGAVHVQRRLLSVGLVELDGTVRAQLQAELDDHPDPKATAQRIVELFGEVVRQVVPPKLVGVGVGASGIIDYPRSAIRTAARYGWTNVPLGAWVSQALGVPVVVDNNARGMALAEHLMGRERRARWLVFLYAGQGTAAGIWTDGDVLRGAQGVAGEIGHTTLDVNGARCWCGNIGCLELALSESAIRQVLGGSSTESMAAMFAKAGRTQQAQVEHVVASALVLLINAYNPDVIVVGGWVDQMWGTMGGAVLRDVNQRTQFWPHSARIVPSSFGGEIGLVGAATIGLGQLVYGVGDDDWVRQDPLQSSRQRENEQTVESVEG